MKPFLKRLGRPALLLQSSVSQVSCLEPRVLLTATPTLNSITPANNATNVAVTAYVGATFHLPAGGLDPNTINTSDVYLYFTSTDARIPAVVNTSGAGDSLILQPLTSLQVNTQYTFVATIGVKDVNGDSIAPFTIMFTTGSTGATIDSSIGFQKVTLPTTSGFSFTCAKIGPDHMLYASTEQGQILRYAINADGALGTPQIITSLQSYEGGDRLVSGFTFDPSFVKNPAAPMIWVNNSYPSTLGSPDYTGKLTIMSGTNLQNVRDAVINLPRSYRDHLNEIPCFGPDGAIYFCQGSSSSFGAPDTTWGDRPEHLLTAAILRVDPSLLPANGSLNVLTPDEGGSYNPYASGAALTIYATGIRNAFSLLWTKDGTLYAPNNGSSEGGNAPAFSATNPNQVNGQRIDTGKPYSGPKVPGITDVSTNEEDYLFKIVKGGYYGHPNPTRGEFVLDGGNPDGSTGTDTFPDYPAGTKPDANYRGYVYDLGTFPSPDGILEYYSPAFGGKLNGDLLISNYSAGGDIVALTRNAQGGISSLDADIPGFSGFNNALTITEDDPTGNVYIAELGAKRITLLKPDLPAPPESPVNLVATGSLGGVSLSWSAGGGNPTTGFKIYRSTSASGTFTLLNSNALVTTTSYADSTAPPGPMSYYQVVAVGAAGGNSAPATISSTRLGGPIAPANFTASATTSQIMLSWTDDAPANIAGYVVLSSSSASGPFTTLNTSELNFGASQFTDTSVAPGATYFFEAIAVDTSGNRSSPSLAQAAVPAPMPTPTPTGVAADQPAVQAAKTQLGDDRTRFPTTLLTLRYNARVTAAADRSNIAGDLQQIALDRQNRSALSGDRAALATDRQTLLADARSARRTLAQAMVTQAQMLRAAMKNLLATMRQLRIDQRNNRKTGR